ncbi:uncharacterized [Tachysurus ichikawai]
MCGLVNQDTTPRSPCRETRASAAHIKALYLVVEQAEEAKRGGAEVEGMHRFTTMTLHKSPFAKPPYEQGRKEIGVKQGSM